MDTSKLKIKMIIIKHCMWVFILIMTFQSCENKVIIQKDKTDNVNTENKTTLNQLRSEFASDIENDIMLFELIYNYTPKTVEVSSDTLLKRLRKYAPAEQLNSVKIKCAFYYIIEKHFNYLAKK